MITFDPVTLTRRVGGDARVADDVGVLEQLLEVGCEAAVERLEANRVVGERLDRTL